MSEIIKIGTKSYHIGLTWRSFEDRINRTELKEISTEINQCDGAYWITDGTRYIWGFATSFDSGQRYTRCSGKKCGGLLALELASRADVLPYAFLLRNKSKHAFVVLDGNRIPLPGSDVWYEDESKMQDALAPYAEIFTDSGDVSRILKLAVFENEDGKPNVSNRSEDDEGLLSLSDYLNNKAPEVTVSNIHYVTLGPRSFKGVGYTLGIIVAFGLVGYTGYEWYSFHEKPIKNISHVVTNWHPPIAVKKAPPKPVIVKTIPDEYFIKECRSLYKLPYVLYGYRMESASCQYGQQDHTINMEATYRLSKPVIIPDLPKQINGWSLSMNDTGNVISASLNAHIKNSTLVNPMNVHWQTLQRETHGSHGMVSIIPGANVNSVQIKSYIGLSAFSDILHNKSFPVMNLQWQSGSWVVHLGESVNKAGNKVGHPVPSTLLSGNPAITNGGQPAMSVMATHPMQQGGFHP